MNLNLCISGASLYRLSELSTRTRFSQKYIARKALRCGLEVLERAYRISSKMKKFITAHPRLSHEECAARLKSTPPVIRRCRRELVMAYLECGKWALKSDAVIGKKFGLPTAEVFHMRLDARFLRLRGINPEKGETASEKYIARLGGIIRIRYLLTEGGKNLREIFSDAGITGMTRERKRQIIADAGLTADESNRTVLWYARNLLGNSNRIRAEEIADPFILRQLLVKTGGTRALAGHLGISEVRLRNFTVQRMNFTSPEDKTILSQHGEMIELRCSESTKCGRIFYRRKAEILYRQKNGDKPQALFFCCRACQGRYIGMHYGGTHTTIGADAVT